MPRHTIGCPSCQATHETVEQVRDCHREARGGYLDLRDFDLDQAAEIRAEGAWLRAAEAGNPDTWAEDARARMAGALGYCPPPGL